MDDISPERRGLILAPLLSLLPAGLLTTPAEAAGPDPTMTIVRLPQQITWSTPEGFPPNSVENAPLWSSTLKEGIYLTLVRWHPGYMSAPHWYATDRYCVVVSGTWWVNSGGEFRPDDTVPVPAGSFVHRVARTPHYDGVKKDGKEPAVIAICGIGPIPFNAVDPAKPAWRKL